VERRTSFDTPNSTAERQRYPALIAATTSEDNRKTLHADTGAV
jgi:hypothetical protein